MKKILKATVSLSLLINLGATFAQDDFPGLDNPAALAQALEGTDISMNFGVTKDYRQSRFQKARVLTLDTRDQKKCLKIIRDISKSGTFLKSEGEICRYIKGEPFVSVVGGHKGTSGTEGGLSLTFSELSPKEQHLVKQTRNMTLLASGAIALLYALPQDFTGWDDFVWRDVPGDYIENISEGPEVEDNHWVVNFIGHPYSGAIYYTTARHAGFNRGQSFGYSVFMSTVFWEYGIEAIAQVPSIQDLIITPIFGSILGEAMFIGEKRLRESGGLILGSKRLGSVALFALNPAGTLLEYSDSVFGQGQFIKDAEGYLRLSPNPNGSAKINWGIELKF